MVHCRSVFHNHKNSNAETTTGSEFNNCSTLPVGVYQPSLADTTIAEPVSTIHEAPKNKSQSSRISLITNRKRRKVVFEKRQAKFKQRNKLLRIEHTLTILGLILIIIFLCLCLWFTEEAKRKFSLKPKSDLRYEIKKSDECSNIQHDCDENAHCALDQDGFSCRCKRGYRGNGLKCTGKLTVSS